MLKRRFLSFFVILIILGSESVYSNTNVKCDIISKGEKEMDIAFIETETDNSLYENAEFCIEISDFLGFMQFKAITNFEEAKAMAFNILSQLNSNNMFINYTVHTIIHYKNIDMWCLEYGNIQDIETESECGGLHILLNSVNGNIVLSWIDE